MPLLDNLSILIPCGVEDLHPVAHVEIVALPLHIRPGRSLVQLQLLN